MIGVVLWSGPDDGKAVFWCEDQGDLAYFEGTLNQDGSYAVFNAGDMVQFDVTVDARVRKAHNARLVQEQACVGLQETLRGNGAQPHPAASAHQSAEIIPFSPRDDQHPKTARRTIREA
jgi:hypothetical protein